MKKGFYTGRFQPFHLGHLSAIKQALKEVNFLYICIGSAQYHHTPENPFTEEERSKMIRKAMLENGIPEDRFKILPLPDIHSNPKWPAYAQKTASPFQRVFVGDDGLVKELFEKYTDIPVTIVKKEVDICATDIRKMMAEGGNWKKCVPKECAEVLEKMDGIRRIKKGL